MRAAGGSLASLVARATGWLATLAIVPLTIGAIGREMYGAWMAILGVVALLSFADLGIGNAIITRVSHANAAQVRARLSQEISSALALLCGIAAVLVGLATAMYFWVDSAKLLNVDATQELSTQVRRALFAVIVLYAISLPVNVVTGVRRGLQEMHVSALLEIPQAVIRVATVALAVRVGAPLWVLASVAFGTQMVAPLLSWAMLRSQDRADISLRNAHRQITRLILRSGLLFLGVQVAVLIGYSSDTVIAARLFGAAKVADYALPSQLAIAGIGVISIGVAPLWGAYADAVGRGDSGWARETFRKSLVAMSAVGFLGAVAYLLIAPSFIGWWSRGRVQPSISIIAGFALWILLSSIGSALATFLNALHIVKLQLIASLSMAALNIVTSVALARRVGVSGLIWGTVIAFTVCILVPYTVVLPRLLRGLITSHPPTA
jgi:O-antigen/teichoic acid export membrane protein